MIKMQCPNCESRQVKITCDNDEKVEYQCRKCNHEFERYYCPECGGLETWIFHYDGYNSVIDFKCVCGFSWRVSFPLEV